MDWLVSLNAIRAQLAAADEDFFCAMRHGSMSVELYAPRGRDPQQPHTQDEIYIVHAGIGTFVKGNVRKPFKPGDVIFVEAGIEHRFENFSHDFETWVVFWGPEGGERPTS